MRAILRMTAILSVACLWIAGVSVAQTSETAPADEPAAAGETAPAAAPAEPPAAAPAVSTGTTTTSGGTQVQAVREGQAQEVASYAIQLRDLEQQINQLKQEVFRSKTRLAQLAESVVQGTGTGRCKIRLVHRNQMSGTFQLVKIAYFLDRSPVFTQTDETGEMGNLEQIDLYESIIAPGDHAVSVEIEYRGYGHGIFSYLQGYRFRVNSSHTFTISGGKQMTIEGIGFEEGGPLTPIQDRPSVRFTEQVIDLAAGSEAVAGGQ